MIGYANDLFNDHGCEQRHPGDLGQHQPSEDRLMDEAAEIVARDRNPNSERE